MVSSTPKALQHVHGQVRRMALYISSSRGRMTNEAQWSDLDRSHCGLHNLNLPTRCDECLFVHLRPTERASFSTARDCLSAASRVCDGCRLSSLYTIDVHNLVQIVFWTSILSVSCRRRFVGWFHACARACLWWLVQLTPLNSAYYWLKTCTHNDI